MRKITFLLGILSVFFAYAQNDSVTFKVDMSNYSATSYTTVHLNASFNSWCGTCNPMSDANNDSIWEVTLPLTADTIEYKFTLDGWTGQETLPQSLPCTAGNAVNNNRVLIFTTDTVLPVVCWQSCDSCTTLLPVLDLPIDWEGSGIDYTVSDFGGNASTLTTDPTNANNTVLKSEKTAGAQTWAGTTFGAPGLASAIPFTATSNIITANVWSPDTGINVMLKAEDKSDPTKSVETFANNKTSVAGGWQTMTFDFSTQRPLTAPINYTYTYDKLSIFYDFDVAGGSTGVTYYCDDIVFGAGPPPGTHNVTFQLDMNQYSGTFTTPEVNGTFNNWCGNCAAMSDANGDNVWDITIPLTEDSIEFKYSFDNWAGQETLLAGSPCTKTTGANVNRFLIVKDTILPPVCWESCTACTGIPASAEVTFQLDLRNYTGTYSTVNLNGTFNNWCGSCWTMTDVDNDSIFEFVGTIPTVDTVDFKYTLDGWTTEENLSPGLSCTKTTTDATGTFTNRFLVAMGDTTIPAVCWEYCVDCNSIGIDEAAWMQDLLITPNPSNGEFNVAFSLTNTSDVTLSVSDIQGRVVYKTIARGDMLNKNIDLSNVSSGMYLLNISSEYGSTTEKIIIER